MIDAKKLFPIIRSSVTKGTDDEVMQAIEGFAKENPDLDNLQALAAIQKVMQQKESPSIGGMALEGQL